MSRIVVARLAGPAPACTSAATTSRSSERGYTCPTLVSTASKPRWAATAASSASTLAGEPSRSSMSCWVPTGPFMPRSG